MALANPFSVPGATPSLHLFGVPATHWTNPIIEFLINPLSDYIDITKTELRMVVKTTNEMDMFMRREKKVHDSQQCTSFFQQTVNLQDQWNACHRPFQTQAYNNNIKTFLIFMEQAKKSYLTKALYYRDTAEHMDGKETPQIAMLV